jgi:hypothetical protein
MNTIPSLSMILEHAIEGMHRNVHQIENIAEEMIVEDSNQPGDAAYSRRLALLTDLRVAELHTRANAAMFHSADELIRELMYRPRR